MSKLWDLGGRTKRKKRKKDIYGRASINEFGSDIIRRFKEEEDLTYDGGKLNHRTGLSTWNTNQSSKRILTT